MNLEQLIEGLEAIYPTRFSHFSETQATPFICWTDNGSESFFADNKILLETTDISIELYTDTKDFEAENKIKQFLIENELLYTRSPTIRIASEGIYKTTYEVTI